MAKKSENLKVLDKDVIEKRVIDLEEQIRVIRFKGQGAKSKNVKEAGMLKRQIARLLTELRSKNK